MDVARVGNAVTLKGFVRVEPRIVVSFSAPCLLSNQLRYSQGPYVFNLCPWSDWAILATCFQISSHRCLISALSASAKSSSIL